MTVQTEQHEAVTAPAAPDFEMRLAFAEATVAALMAHKYGEALNGANEAFQDARQATPEPVEERTFRSNVVLRLAGDVIRKRGWTQGTYEGLEGAVCAMGAIRLVTRGDDWLYRPVAVVESGGTPVNETEAVAELVARIEADTRCKLSVPSWNDSRTSVDDVLRLLY